MSTPFLVDRSRLQTYFDCPRRYYWSYIHEGLGVSGARTPIPLVVGGAVHRGLERLLLGDSEDAASQAATDEFGARLGSGLELQATENAKFVYDEQRALTEALVRVYALRGLPQLLGDYDVLEVEQEDNLDLADGIVLMVRADGLLRRRSDGNLYVLSFKTANRYDGRKSSDANHDVQGLSEFITIQRRRGEEVIGTQMVNLIKGTRVEYPEDSGVWSQNSSLVHPWRRDSDGALAWSWKWHDGERGRTLGKGWRKCDIWELMPLRDWVDMLASGQIQPEAGDPLAEIVIAPPPYLRRESEAEDWLGQTRALAVRLRDDVACREEHDWDLKEYLNVTFPQNRRSCDYPGRCPMQDICFGPCGDDPIGSGLYQVRQAHHALEKELAGQ